MSHGITANRNRNRTRNREPRVWPNPVTIKVTIAVENQEISPIHIVLDEARSEAAALRERGRALNTQCH